MAGGIHVGMGLEGEMRAQDAANEIAGKTAEAAELAEHIKESDPRHYRDELFDELIGMIDDSHELAVRTEVELDE
jgi:NTP pyrophosphatase (non-canonical NTP hydrolase)